MKRKRRGLFRGAEQHRESFPYGLTYGPGHASRQFWDAAALARGVSGTEKQGAKLTTTSVAPLAMR